MSSAMMQMLWASSPAAANWTLVGVGTVVLNSTVNGGAISVAPPAGTSLNDTMVLVTAVASSSTVATPSGWAVPSGTTSPNGLDVFVKIAGASEGSVSVSANTNGIQGVIFTFRGINTTTPVNVAAQATGTGAFAAFAAATTTVPNCPVLMAVCAAGLSAYTPGSAANLTSYSELVDSQNDYTGAIPDTSLAVYLGTMPGAGSTGTPAATNSLGGVWGSMTIALQPA